MILSVIVINLIYYFHLCNSETNHDNSNNDNNIINVALKKLHLKHLFEKISLDTAKLSNTKNHTNENKLIDYTRYSSIHGLCDHLDKNEMERLACCSKYPLPFYYLHNIKIENEKIIYYLGDNSVNGKPRQLPGVISLIRRQQHLFNMNIEVRNEAMDLSSCSSYYNGTLYIAGRYTTQNLFHVMNDNIIPLLSQIVLDVYLRNHMMFRPKALLEGFQPKDVDEIPHLSILKHIVPTSFTLKKANTMCFHTIVWGNGIKLIYTHLLGYLRRIVSDLLREIIILAFNPANPYLMSPPATTGSIPNTKNTLSIVNYSLYPRDKDKKTVSRPMNIVIFTRGSSGEGRTMAGEHLLQKRLSDLGAIAYICCEFKSISLGKQLSYALYADVIIGLHGAGLMNSFYAPKGVITVELKTIYGYDLTLFAVASEARLGTHIELNIKPYHQWGKPVSKNNPMDVPLMNRITTALYKVISYRELEYNQIIYLQNKYKSDWELQYFKKLSLYNFRKSLFEILTSHKGDAIMYPYPLKYYDDIRNHHYYHSNNHNNNKELKNTTHLQILENILSSSNEKYNFLLHILGPKSNKQIISKQCDELILSSYWDHIDADTSRFCLPCQLYTMNDIYNPKKNISPSNNNDNSNMRSKKNNILPTHKRNIKHSLNKTTS